MGNDTSKHCGTNPSELSRAPASVGVWWQTDLPPHPKQF